jgi:DDE superfamily endonuclease
MRYSLERAIYNKEYYRLSRARRVVENAFGILVHRFEIFRSPLRIDIGEAKFTVLACVFLHNWLEKSKCSAYSPAGYTDSEVNNELVPGKYMIKYKDKIKKTIYS